MFARIVFVFGLRLRALLLFEKAFEHLRIGDGCGDPVAFAGPFSQVDQAAAIAAKRKVFTAGQHQAAAGGATKRNGFLVRHPHLDDSRHQIVVVRFGDFAAVEAARNQLFVRAKVVDEQLAVDLRGMPRRTAFPEKIGFF